MTGKERGVRQRTRRVWEPGQAEQSPVKDGTAVWLAPGGRGGLRAEARDAGRAQLRAE